MSSLVLGYRSTLFFSPGLFASLVSGAREKVSYALGVLGTVVLQVLLASSEMVLFLSSDPSVVTLLGPRPLPGPLCAKSSCLQNGADWWSVMQITF